MKKTLVLFSLLLKQAIGCRTLQVSSSELGVVRFNQIPLDDEKLLLHHADNSGRASYISEVREIPIFIYHTCDLSSGIGRWVINIKLGDNNSAMAYINSWAVTPYLITASFDNSIPNYWRIPSSVSKDGWDNDETFSLDCLNKENSTVYFESSSEYQSSLSGFYIERYLTETSEYKKKFTRKSKKVLKGR